MKNKYKGFLILMMNAFVLNASLQSPPPARIQNKDVEFEIHSVYGLNSEFAEFSPVLYKTDFVFTSDRIYDYRNIGEDNWEANKRVNVFTANFEYNNNDSVVFEKVKLFDDFFVDDDHSGPICFSTDGTKAIFTKVSHRDGRKSANFGGEKKGLFSKVIVRPQLYEAKYENGKWQEEVKMPFVKINKSYGHPTLSSDGNTLYFVSDEFGGKGGKDLFYVEMTVNGWSDPRPMNAINTSGDELFPTIAGDRIYFSSNGRGGEGGLDLFVSVLENGNWSEPINLGASINTSADEFGMVFNPDKLSGYFTSNRENGMGSDDIYHFDMIETVTVEDNSISGMFTYKYLENENPDGLEVYLLDEDGNLVATTRTNADGTFDFRNLKSDGKYTIKLAEEGEDVELTLYGKENSSFLLANQDGEFVYRKLSNDKIGTLALMDEEDIDPLTREGSISGQFVYTKLKSNAEGLEVYLMDEDGNIVQRTTTDANGNFNFKKLSADNNYTIKTGDLSDDVELYIYDKNDVITAVLASNADGEFLYRKLDPDFANRIDQMQLDEEDLTFVDETQMISGEFKYRSLSEKMNIVDYQIYDENYNLLREGETNEESFFRHFSMPNAEKLIFKIDPEQYKADVDLRILDRNRELVIQLNKNDEGYFIYQKLKSDDTGLMTDEEVLSTLKTEEGVAGQFLYKKLTSSTEFLEYEIYDEEGNLLKRGFADKNGLFAEPSLSKDETYRFKLLNSDEDVRLRYYDEETGQLVILDKLMDGYFAYGKLGDTDTVFNTEDIEDSEMTIRNGGGNMASENDLFYAHNVYKLSANNKSKLDAIVKKLNAKPNAKVVVYGHASLEGPDDYNLKLSARRMNEAIEYLVDSGIDQSRVKGEFYGEEKPMVDCKSKHCSDSEIRKNRRTEVIVMD